MTVISDQLRERFAHLKLFALDVDGVLTDGGLYYTETGEELKKFNVKDGLGLKLLMAQGIQVAIISSNHSKATLHRARKLNITHTFIGVEHKLTVLENLCQQMGISLEEAAYIGDDLPDLPLLEAVGCPLTVADASPQNKHVAIYITQCPGGQGAVREICDRILACRGQAL
jgi:3-deoxy-D-manno-octulosonate 8-phosphate phosphatase (KDO 8-P phosphatase)